MDNTYMKCKLSEARDVFGGGLKGIICSSSFEDRCLSIPLLISAADLASAVIVSKGSDSIHVSRNRTALLDHFGDKAQVVSDSCGDPIAMADSLKQRLEHLKSTGDGSYVIDITTFTHEVLLILLRIIEQVLDSRDRVFFAYNPSTDYCSNVKLEEKWLSKGIGEIRSVLGYPGKLRPSQKSHLIVLLGYETERAELLIDSYEPAIISLGVGARAQSVSTALHDINLEFHNKLKQKLSNVYEFTFSCVNPHDTKEAILAQADKFPDFNIVIAPMNTKISTIGAALACLQNDRIQLCYAQAQQYNYDNYSIPSDECYILELPEIHSRKEQL